MVTFDPYNDRLARDIRNSMSSALTKELIGDAEAVLSAVTNGWKEMALAPIYQSYIAARMVLYRRAISEIRTNKIVDPRIQAIYLWNLGLFFEMHELLETVWRKAVEPERSALKGWIQAAGVYEHLQRGKVNAARNLARRAEGHLRAGRSFLSFISNLEQLIEAVADPSNTAPKMIYLQYVPVPRSK